MKTDQFGSVQKYKMLEYLVEHINLLDKNKREYISKFITSLNTKVKKFDDILDIPFKNYLLDLAYDNYINEISKFNYKYDRRILSSLRNYVYAKIKNARKAEYVEYDGHTYLISNEKIRKGDLYIVYDRLSSFKNNLAYIIATATSFSVDENDIILVNPSCAKITLCKKLILKK